MLCKNNWRRTEETVNTKRTEGTPSGMTASSGQYMRQSHFETNEN